MDSTVDSSNSGPKDYGFSPELDLFVKGSASVCFFTKYVLN